MEVTYYFHVYGPTEQDCSVLPGGKVHLWYDKPVQLNIIKSWVNEPEGIITMRLTKENSSIGKMFYRPPPNHHIEYNCDSKTMSCDISKYLGSYYAIRLTDTCLKKEYMIPVEFEFHDLPAVEIKKKEPGAFLDQSKTANPLTESQAINKSIDPNATYVAAKDLRVNRVQIPDQN